MFDFFTEPGKILKEYLDAREITQRELAKKINSSERHISEVINGKARISEEFALKLETVFPDVDAEFWLALETKYQLFLLRNKDTIGFKQQEIIDDYKLNHVFKGKSYTTEKKISEFLKIVGESSINSLNKSLEQCSALFMHDGGTDKLLYFWLKLCEQEIENQNDLNSLPAFNHEKFLNEYMILKKLLYTRDYELALSNTRRFLNANGIGLVLKEALPNSKVRGAVTKYKEYLMIYLSTRYKRIDSLYFALMHEIFHIVNKDYEKEELVLSYDESEAEIMSNKSAQNFFIPKNIYNEILKELREKRISDEELIIQANKHKVLIDILIGFLQRDGHIEYNQYNHLRNYIKEDD